MQTAFTHDEIIHKVSVLIKAALDAASELDWAKNHPSIDPETRDINSQTVERVYNACEALGAKIGTHDEIALEEINP